MSKAEYTPGPWGYDNKIAQIRGADGSGLTLASIHRNPGLPMGQGTANGRLMAAAPDLLEFARSVVREEERLRILAKQNPNSHWMDEWEAVSHIANSARVIISEVTSETSKTEAA